MNVKSTPVSFATGRSLEQAKAFFDASGTGVGVKFPDAEPLRPSGGTWKVTAEWDASHSVPRRGDGKRINEPALVEWSPNGEELVTACDAFGLTRWRTDGRRLGGGTSPYAYGDPKRFFWSPDGGLVLLEARTAQNNWWSVQDRNGRVIRQVVANGILWGSDGLNEYGLHRTRYFNPWRPGASQLLVAGYEGPRLDLIDVSSLPEPKTGRGFPLPIAIAVGLTRYLISSVSGSRADDETLKAVTVSKSVNFAPLGAQDRSIMRFAWHPSGKYVAVTTGHPENKSVRRVHVLDYEAGQIVASVPQTTSALGWSPGGRLLFCQRWTNAYSDDWKIETFVWDAHTWTSRELSEEERKEPWARHFEFSRLGVGDNALNADGTLTANPNPHSGWGAAISSVPEKEDEVRLPVEGKVPYLAWSPVDPRCLATVGGKDAPRSLRIWKLREAQV